MKKLTCLFVVMVVLFFTIPMPGYAGGTRVYFGVGIGAPYPRAWVPYRAWWGPRYYWGGPIAAVPYYSAPPVVIQQPPPVYAQPEQPQAEAYWYYCRDPQGYYPYVKSCPGGWMKVVPNPGPSNP
jgi:hypothetical protein